MFPERRCVASIYESVGSIHVGLGHRAYAHNVINPAINPERFVLHAQIERWKPSVSEKLIPSIWRRFGYIKTVIQDKLESESLPGMEISVLVVG